MGRVAPLYSHGSSHKCHVLSAPLCPVSDRHVLEKWLISAGCHAGPSHRHMLVTLSPRFRPAAKIKVGLCPTAATLWRRCRHIVPRCASLCFGAATQHNVPKRIVAYHNVS